MGLWMAEEKNGILLIFILFVGLSIVTASLYIAQAGWPGIQRGLSAFGCIKGICYHAWLDFFYSSLSISLMG